jgi:hypothetical protein
MSDGQVQPSEQPTVAFVLSLLAGLWMLGMGGMMDGFGWGMMGGGRGLGYGQGMGQWEGMQGWMWGRGMQAFGLRWPWFGLLAGIVVIIGAVMMYTKPQQHRSWGIVILVLSALDFLLGMGGVLAATLGVVGGALALSGEKQ